MILTDNSCIVTNDTQGPQKYPHHWKLLQGHTYMCKHGTKTTPVFLPTIEDGFWLLLPGSVSVLSGGTMQPENTYSYILKVTGEVWESQRRISINSNHSYHQLSSPEASLNWSNNKIRFSFNQPSRKRWGCEASWCSKTSTS